MHLPRRIQKQIKEDYLKQKTALEKEDRKLQKEAVMADLAQGFTKEQVQLRKEQRQAECRAQKSEKIRQLDQAEIDKLRDEPEQIDLDNLAMERNLRQE